MGGVLYVLAVTHPTPLALRLLLLAGLALFGWLFYVRLPKMPTEITISEDGWVNFQSRRGTTRVQAADIRSIGRSFGRRTLRVVTRRRTAPDAEPIQEATRLLVHHEGSQPGHRYSGLLKVEKRSNFPPGAQADGSDHYPRGSCPGRRSQREQSRFRLTRLRGELGPRSVTPVGNANRPVSQRSATKIR